MNRLKLMTNLLANLSPDELFRPRHCGPRGGAKNDKSDARGEKLWLGGLNRTAPHKFEFAGNPRENRQRRETVGNHRAGGFGLPPD